MLRQILFLGFGWVLAVSQANAQVLIAGWDFQTTTTGGTAAAVSPATPKVYTANFGSGGLYLDGSNGSSNWFVPASGSTGAELTASAGTGSVNRGTGFGGSATPGALSLLGGAQTGGIYPTNGKQGVFKFSMSGMKDLVISFAAERTSTGFTSMQWDYSSDGSSWNSIGSFASGTNSGNINTGFTSTGVLSLSAVTGLDNLTEAWTRVTFTGASNASGRLSLDNIQFNATLIPEPSASMLMIAGLAGLVGVRAMRRKNS